MWCLAPSSLLLLTAEMHSSAGKVRSSIVMQDLGSLIMHSIVTNVRLSVKVECI